MHGRALPLGPHGYQSTRLVEAPMALDYGDDRHEESALGISLPVLRLGMPRGGLLALLIVLLALAAGAASIWLAKPVYSARATIQIDPQAARIPGTENIVPDAARTATDRVLQAQIDLLGSRATAQKVAKKLDLANDPLFLREIGLEDEPAGPTRSAKVAAALHNRLSVSSPRDTPIIDARFDSHDPVAAARIANSFADTFIGESAKRRQVASDYSRRFLKGQLELTTARLERSERNLVNYARSAPLVAADLEAAGSAENVGELRAITAARLAALNAAYSRAQANRMRAEQRWQQALAVAQTSNPGSIIHRAQTPALPSYPRPAMNMAIAALVGALALGANIARSQTKEDGPDEIERDVDAQLLGVVPLAMSGKSAALALSDPLAPGTEAHHAIFVSLDRLARTADQRVLLLTSSCPNEGKTMIAFKLSASFAAAGKKVLVIDTDMRRGSLHQLLGLPNQPGLSDLLARDWAYELTDVAHYCADRGFSVLPRGQSVTDPAELLASRRFAELLDDAANLYDMVIMDGPPVLGLADALRLSGMADATVFVVRANQTLPEHAKLAMRRLSEAGAEQIGLVITEPHSAADSGAQDCADGCEPTAEEAKVVASEVPPRAEPVPATAQPVDLEGQQEGPALPSPWVSWLLQQQEGVRNAG